MKNSKYAVVTVIFCILSFVLTFMAIPVTSVFAQEKKIYDYAYVNRSEPVYEYRYDKVYEECEQEYNYPSNTYNEEADLNTIIGTTIGIAIANQISNEDNLEVARLAGGLMGAALANNRYYNQCSDNYYTQRKAKVLTGYKNYFRYENTEYVKVTKYPKKRIRITKTINF